MVMPRREPTEVIRIPTALLSTVLTLREIHKNKKEKTILKINTILNDVNGGLIKSKK